MIEQSDIIEMVIPESAMPLIKRNAKEAEVGGRSQIRGSDRKRALGVDQMVGQLCNYVICDYLFGSAELYVASRERANRNRYVGDNGRDIPNLPIDVKGSLMRAGSDPLQYRLLVRPKEYHDRWVYVLALVDSIETPVRVFLTGWARSTDIPDMPITMGVLAGALMIPAKDLRPISQLKTAMDRYLAKKQRVTTTLN